MPTCFSANSRVASPRMRLAEAGRAALPLGHSCNTGCPGGTGTARPYALTSPPSGGVIGS
jgi:hypothetical protein